MNIPVKFVKPLKILMIIFSLLAVYSLVGFLLIPALVKWKLPEIISEASGRKTSIEKMQFNPFLLSARIRGFQIQELQEQTFAAFEEFAVDVNALRSMTNLALVLDQVTLAKPFVRIAKQKNGEFNFNDLIKAKEKPSQPESQKIFPVQIAKLALTEGKLVFEDAHATKPVKEDVIPVNLEIENFSTQVDQQSRIGFSMTLSSGGKVDWRGLLSVNPLQSAGHIRLENIKLERISELLMQDKLAFDLQGSHGLEADYDLKYADSALTLAITQSKLGLTEFQLQGKGANKLSLKVPQLVLEGAYQLTNANQRLQLTAGPTRLALQNIQLSGLNPDKVLIKIPYVALESNYQLAFADNQLTFLTKQGKLDVKDFELDDKTQSSTLVKIPALALAGIDFDLAGQQLAVDTLSIDKANLKACLNQDGRVNYQALFSSPEPETGLTTQPSPGAASEPTQTTWRIQVNQVGINDLSLEFEDRTAIKKPFKLDASPVSFKLTHFSNQDGAKFPFQFSAGINKTGLIKFSGDTVLKPLQLQSDIAVKDLALDQYQAYVDRFAHLDVIDGKWNLNGQVSMGMVGKDQLDIKLKGDTSIVNLITRDQKLNKDLVKWKKLGLKDIAVDTLENRYTASALAIDKPYLRVIIRKDKTVNFADLAIAEKSDTKPLSESPKKSASPQKKPVFKLAQFQLQNGSSDFADLSLILPFAAHIESLHGGATGISSDEKSTIKLELKGNAYDLSPVDVKGEISPYLGNYNVELNFQGMPMPLMSPYMAQFAGYKVEKGKMTLGLKYNVANRNLTASNNILIDQFELGEKVENPDAVSLPLDLAIALLKDGEGRIKIDVPITGSLEDPKFSIAGLVVDALVNVISKIVTSPFNAIASLMGSTEDLSVIRFTKGDAALDKQQTAKLDDIAKALKEKPVLSIEVKGAAYQEQDWPALQDDALLDQLKRLRAEEKNQEEGRKTRAEYVELSEDDYQRLLAQEFIKKFPLLGERSLFGVPRLIEPAIGDFYQVAKQKLAALIKPEPQRLKDLAAHRAQAIAKYLVKQGGIASERVFILDTAIDPKRENDEIVTLLSLKANGT